MSTAGPNATHPLSVTSRWLLRVIMATNSSTEQKPNCGRERAELRFSFRNVQRRSLETRTCTPCVRLDLWCLLPTTTPSYFLTKMEFGDLGGYNPQPGTDTAASCGQGKREKPRWIRLFHHDSRGTFPMRNGFCGQG